MARKITKVINLGKETRWRSAKAIGSVPPTRRIQNKKKKLTRLEKEIESWGIGIHFDKSL